MPPQVFHLSRCRRIEGVPGVAGEIDAVADRHRTGGAGSDKRGFPTNVLMRRPFRGKSLFGTDSLPARTAKLTPIRGRSSADCAQQPGQTNDPPIALHNRDPKDRCCEKTAVILPAGPPP